MNSIDCKSCLNCTNYCNDDDKISFTIYRIIVINIIIVSICICIFYNLYQCYIKYRNRNLELNEFLI